MKENDSYDKSMILEEFFQRWLKYINSPCDVPETDLVVEFDTMLVYNGQHLVATVPSNDGWFVVNGLEEETYIMSDSQWEGISVITNPDEAILNYDTLINVILWNDQKLHYDISCIAACEPYFDVESTWDIDLMFVPDVQSELNIKYSPQEWFPYNVKKHPPQTDYMCLNTYIIRCYNVKTGALVEYDEEDSVFGIRELKNWDDA